ncbi:hypothetical protein QFC19_009275 [Naganishia cerealis]|uniref:Uncharacterized protein n=1 Tax=Naganishia cerealis TaxID=610337 RepID=A0ACC2UVZ9_9TREE|nr:hypothetical protein QFC19_009275 [Naganishia cerealis]
MSSEIMFDIDTSPVLTRAALCRSSSGNNLNQPTVHTSDSRFSWSLPSSPVSTVRREAPMEPDVVVPTLTFPTRQSPKRPSYMSRPSFARSFVPISSAFSSTHSSVLQQPGTDHGDSIYPATMRCSSDANSEDIYTSLSSHPSFITDMMTGASPASPTRFPFGMFPDLATSPADLNHFPFCHFEQVLSPSASMKELDGAISGATPGSDNYIVAGCLLSGCDGHEPTHDQDGHPSPAVWTPTSLAAMRKRWRNMRKQPPAQTAVPLRPCLKKMSTHATTAAMCDTGIPSNALGRNDSTLSTSSFSSSSTAFDDTNEEHPRLAPIDTDLTFAAMTVAEWSAVSGSRSRSTSGSSSTMLFSPFLLDHEDRDHLAHGFESEMPDQLYEEELTEVEEYMLQGLLRAFQKPQREGEDSSAGLDLAVPQYPVSAEIVEDDCGTTPRPTSILDQYVNFQNETIRKQAQPQRSAVTFNSNEALPTSIMYESPKSLESEPLPQLTAIIDGLGEVSFVDAQMAVPPSANSATLPINEQDAEIDGEWQWACPITVPLPVRAGISTVLSSAVLSPHIHFTSSTTHPSGDVNSNLPSRSNSVVSSSASTAGEKRRVHFPVCPGGSGEMALCALYPTYSATDYDRTPLEPPSEEERSCRMPERGSRCVLEEVTPGFAQEDAEVSEIFDRGSSLIEAQEDDRHAGWNDNCEYGLPGGRDETAAALAWSCSSDLTEIYGGVHNPSEADDNWEEWLDRRKTSCNLTTSSSTDTLKAAFGQSTAMSDSLLTPTNTPLEQSPLHSPSLNRYSDVGEVPSYTSTVSTAGSDTSSLLTLLEQEDMATVSDTPSLAATASSGDCSTADLNTVKDVQPTPQYMDVTDDSDDMQSWLPHPNNRKKDFGVTETSSEISTNTALSTSSSATTTTTSIPKLTKKKKKKSVSSEKRTTLWTQTQSSWGRFGSDSWSTGEEGCLGGF